MDLLIDNFLQNQTNKNKPEGVGTTDSLKEDFKTPN